MTHIATNFPLSPLLLLNSHCKPCYPFSSSFSKPSTISRVGKVRASSRNESKTSSLYVEQKLEPLWDDGYGSRTAKDYFEAAKSVIEHSDGGPPRWFCPTESGPPLKNSPLLLFLPGMDGLGMGMILHHKALGKVFEVRCMHIPVYDRTPYEGLMKFVEDAVRVEHALYPKKPIYLVGDSFGGCLALSVAANNPMIDLVLILVNPATSFDKSKFQHLLPFLESLPEEFYILAPYVLGFTLGDPIKMANVINYTQNLLASPVKQIEKLFIELNAVVTGVSSLVNIFPKETLMWKLRLLKTAADHSNSRLRAVKAEVLLLASGKDSILPSEAESQRLSSILENCKSRVFKENGHILLMEDGINFLTIIKGTSTYRRSKIRNLVTDFIPPSISEFHHVFDQRLGLYHLAISPVTFSTLADGEIVRGLKGVPDKGPILLVGYHMLFGLEIGFLLQEFLKEKNVMVHGMAHPQIFSKKVEGDLQEMTTFDVFKVFGAVPATAKTLFKMLSTDSHLLLYPGGVREALHRKGEAYKLFWPEETEFVRTAARFGATIVPFGVVGEDDMLELFLDYNDLVNVPFMKDMMRVNRDENARVRKWRSVEGEVSNQDIYVPGFYPKLPGRVYFLFGKPLETKGRGDLVRNKDLAKEFYVEIKSEVERSMAYLVKKRKEDPYRYLSDRMSYRAISAPIDQVPSFDP